jgi:uncharacterized protein (DUF58 family)
MVPTRRFWILIALGIPLGAVAGYIGSPWLVVAYNIVVFAAAYVSGLLAPSWKCLKITRQFDAVLSVRVPNKITVKVLNDGPEHIKFRMREEPPPLFTVPNNEFNLDLRPGEEQTVTYSITPNERGGDYFRGTFVRIHAPFNLVEREVRLHTEQPLRVYPNILALREFDLLKQRGRLQEVGIRRSRSKGLGMEFESLRDYTEGDDFRKIDWKATARRSKLVVRNYEQEKNQSVIICVDIGRKTLSEVNGVAKLDHMLDSSLMLCHAAMVAGDCVGLLVFADNVRRYIPPRKGRSQIGFIIEAMHDLVSEPVESDPAAAFAYLASRWKRRSLVVVFTDVDDADQAKSLGGAFGPIARHHIALLASVGDPGLKLDSEQSIDTSDDMYRKAASLFLLSEKKMASSILGSQNIHMLEAEPQDLAAALVSYYFMVKERSLL